MATPLVKKKKKERNGLNDVLGGLYYRLTMDSPEEIVVKPNAQIFIPFDLISALTVACLLFKNILSDLNTTCFPPQ